MADTCSYPDHRPPAADRRFVSAAVEAKLSQVRAAIADDELAWLLGNCYANTLDTTVWFDGNATGGADTFIITGDIDAMWLRDSTNQVWPYLPLASADAELAAMFEGLVRRQVRCVLLDPYANAFYRDAKLGEWQHDHTDMTPGVHERKYELDSLCAVLRLSAGVHDQLGAAGCFDDRWQQAIGAILKVIADQQAPTNADESPPYRFQRQCTSPTETLALGGRGQPAKRCGLSQSPFRPSDDAAHLPFLVPANAMAVATLRQLVTMWRAMKLPAEVGDRAAALADEIDAALREHAIVDHREFGRIYAYEVDGFGSHYLMDDANVPSLLSLPYLGYCDAADETYQRTRRFLLSEANPYFSRPPEVGSVGGVGGPPPEVAAAGQVRVEGIGGPHVGAGFIWPMSIIMRAMTSDDDDEIIACLRMLKSTHAGTGFMHETFWKDDPSNFTRKWFAWANSLFGELICKLYADRPHVLGEEL
jgi:meiotically up-regulated gene 157 (Mug157) protein